jgi:hypothetical protein
MPHDVITLREDVLEKTEGNRHDMVVRAQYEAPSGPNLEVAEDKHKGQDMANARWMMDVLMRVYPGRPWFVKHDGAQGIADISIPILMGTNDVYRINIRKDPLNEGLLTRCAGELLERYSMSRTRFNLGEFLDAREKHSALVLPFRKVPG